jgi:hypothetical protein
METSPKQSNFTQEIQLVSVSIVVNGTTGENYSTTNTTADIVNESLSILSICFEIAVIFLGVFGSVANGTTLWVFLFAKEVMKFSFIFMPLTSQASLPCIGFNTCLIHRFVT